MKMSTTQKKKNVRAKAAAAAAFREAGHAVAAWRMQIMLEPLSIRRAANGGQGNAWNDALRNVDFDWAKRNDSASLIERLATVLVAGPVAQRLFAPRMLRGPVCAERLRQARTLLGAIPGKEESGTVRLRRLQKDAEVFLGGRRIRSAIYDLQDALVNNGGLTGDEALHMIEKHAPSR